MKLKFFLLAPNYPGNRFVASFFSMKSCLQTYRTKSRNNWKMDDSLSNLNIYFDEENKVRIVNPENTELTKSLVKQCSHFIEATSNFGKIVDEFIDLFANIALEIDRNRIKAFGTRNLLYSFQREKDTRFRQLYSELAQKQTQLEELKIEHQSLRSEENEQEYQLQKLTFQK